MGLDMFLSKQRDGCDGKEWDVGYWRKANAIHGWFVDYIQEGFDECQKSLVTKSDLQNLLETCQDVLSIAKLDGKDNVVNVYKVKKILPTRSGFFFGSTDCGPNYIRDIKDTIEILNRVLKETDFNTEKIFYQASW